MKKSLFLFIALILMLLATVGFAEKAEKAKPSKTRAAVQIRPAEAQQSQVQPAPAAPTAGEEINWQVISQGVTDGGSASYQLGGTLSQTAIGFGTSASYNLESGFWQEFGKPYACGNANEDGVVDIGDVVYIINYLFRQPWPPPQPYMCVGDANNDNVVDIGDVVYIINYLFRQPWPPPDPDCCNPPWKDER